MRKLSLLLVCFLLAGCATVRSIKRDFLKVNLSDGVNQDEAMLIGRNALVDSGKKGEYKLVSPEIYDDDEAASYPSYWLVHFPPRIYDYEIATSLYLVVIHKESGQIKYSGVRRTINENKIDWIFE